MQTKSSYVSLCWGAVVLSAFLGIQMCERVISMVNVTFCISEMVNPFAMSKTTNNPFNAPRESANRVPIRQLAASQPPAGFQSFGGPQGLPAPLVPMNSQTGNNTNPFL